MTYLVKLLGVRQESAISGTREQRIAAIAKAQRGRVARRQLRAAGVPGRTIDNLVARGYLHRERRGVFAVGHLAAVPLGPETSALLACGEGAVLSHLSAASIWNLLPQPNGGPIEVTIAGRNGAQPVGVHSHRCGPFHRNDVRIHLELPITSPARTLLDIADLVSGRQLERALDAALRRLLGPAQVRDAVSRAPGRRAATLLSAALERRTGSTDTRSDSEERFLELVRAARLPPPEVNVSVCGYLVDFLWRRQRVIVEIDGYDYHTSRFEFNRDRRKDAVLKAAGLDPNRFSADELEDAPFAVIATVARILGPAQFG